jgi:hypothetical protein
MTKKINPKDRKIHNFRLTSSVYKQVMSEKLKRKVETGIEFSANSIVADGMRFIVGIRKLKKTDRKLYEEVISNIYK